MKDWLIVICIGIIAVLAFRERERWRSPQTTPNPSAASTISAPLSPETSSPFNAPPEAQPTPGSPDPAALAQQVAQSQRLAVAKYPPLGTAESEIYIRFTYRYKLLLNDHSPRLQDPAWPLRLADECAQASGLSPVKTHPPTGAPKPASRRSDAVQPVSVSAPVATR